MLRARRIPSPGQHAIVRPPAAPRRKAEPVEPGSASMRASSRSATWPTLAVGPPSRNARCAARRTRHGPTARPRGPGASVDDGPAARPRNRRRSTARPASAGAGPERRPAAASYPAFRPPRTRARPCSDGRGVPPAFPGGPSTPAPRRPCARTADAHQPEEFTRGVVGHERPARQRVSSRSPSVPGAASSAGGQTVIRPPLAWNSDTMRAASASLGLPPAARAAPFCAATWKRARHFGPLGGGSARRLRLVGLSVAVVLHGMKITIAAGGAATAPASPDRQRKLGRRPGTASAA